MFTETVSPNGVQISAELLESAGIHLGDSVELKVEGDQLILRSVDATERARRFQEAKENVFSKHHRLFEALAEGAP